jgi:hypothetical protein
MEVWLLEIVSPKCAGRLLICGTERVRKRLFKPQECYTTKNIKALLDWTNPFQQEKNSGQAIRAFDGIP